MLLHYLVEFENPKNAIECIFPMYLTSVGKNFGKRTVQYKASKIWNLLPTSLKGFYTVTVLSNLIPNLNNSYSQQPSTVSFYNAKSMIEYCSH